MRVRLALVAVVFVFGVSAGVGVALNRGLLVASCSHRECQTTECVRTGPNNCTQYEYGQARCVYHNVNQGNGTQKWSGTGSTRVKYRSAMCSSGDYCSPTTGYPQVGNSCSGSVDWQFITTDEERNECCTVGVEQPQCSACGG